jgi:acyl-CoA dehydrogenase
VLHIYGSSHQKRQWLKPLLNGVIRSGFAMTEPDVASSDARNINTSITRDGDHYVINGRKWWTTGAMDSRCKILIVMGKTNPDADTYHQQSMILVPMDTPGVEIIRNVSVFGYVDQHGHAEITFTNVRVPAENLIGEAGSGFAIAQARLGPGRVHHCMRAIGMAERALSLMLARSMERVTFGKELARQGVVQEWIAHSRIDIDQARLLVLKTAWIIDTEGAKNARKEIAAIKVAVPQMAQKVIDRAIQTYGGAGISQDTPLAGMYAGIRALRIADGPDEVHLRDIARLELKEHFNRAI